MPADPCPICRRIVDPPTEESRKTSPFCSERCRQVDLMRWMNQRYAIASPVTDPDLLEELADQAEQAANEPPEE